MVGKAVIPSAPRRRSRSSRSVVRRSTSSARNATRLKLRMARTALRRLQRLSGCTYTSEHSRSGEDVVDVDRDREDDVPTSAASSADQLRQSRMGSTSSGAPLPERRNVLNVAIAGGIGRGPADEPNRGKVPRCGSPARAAARPLRAYVVLLELPGLQVQASEADQGHRRAVPEDGGIIAERRGRSPAPSTDASNYPNCDFSFSSDRLRTLSAVRQPVPSLTGAQVGTSSPATRPDAASREPPGDPPPSSRRSGGSPRHSARSSPPHGAKKPKFGAAARRKRLTRGRR